MISLKFSGQCACGLPQPTGYGVPSKWGGMSARDLCPWHELGVIAASELIRDLENVVAP